MRATFLLPGSFPVRLIVAITMCFLLLTGCGGVGTGGTGSSRNNGGSSNQNPGGNSNPGGSTSTTSTSTSTTTDTVTIPAGSAGSSPVLVSFSYASSTVQVNANPVVPDADMTAAVAGNTAFALNYFANQTANNGNNLVFSPFSITMAAAMLAPGTAGSTLDGIQQALSFQMPQDRLAPALGKLNLFLANEASGNTVIGVQQPSLKSANSVWLQQGFTVQQGYLDFLAGNYGTGVRFTDFVTTPDTSRQTINAWVATQTNGQIQNLLPQGTVDDGTRLALTNATWFKGSWQSPFTPALTANQPFHNHDGSSSSVPFMKQEFDVRYAQTSGCQAVDIPYAGDDLSMLFILPDAQTFDSFLTTLTPGVLGSIVNGLAVTDVILSLPKFSFDTATDLSSVLQALGMTAAFDPLQADLSPMDGKRDLHVSAAVHQATISVDENGTEASAATGIATGITAIGGPPPTPLLLTLDRPFLFLLRDRHTGLILFMGKVAAL